MSKFFAKIDKNNIVIDILVAEQAFIDTLPKEDGTYYVESTNYVYGGKEHDKQNNELQNHNQMNSATIGGGYIPDKDIFYDAQPYPSWSLNSVYDWEPPIPEPDDDCYYWDEDAYQNDDTTGWCLPNFQPVNGEEGGEELIE